MNQKETVSNDTILYAQALQIAILLSEGKKPLSTSFPNVDSVNSRLLEYRELTKCVLGHLDRN